MTIKEIADALEQAEKASNAFHAKLGAYWEKMQAKPAEATRLRRAAKHLEQSLEDLDRCAKALQGILQGPRKAK